MAQYRISRKSFTISRVGILWVVSIIWLINITPLMCGIQIINTPSDNSHIADNKDTHTPNMLIAPLNEKDLLLRGINMPWYTNTQKPGHRIALCHWCQTRAPGLTGLLCNRRQRFRLQYTGAGNRRAQQPAGHYIRGR